MDERAHGGDHQRAPLRSGDRSERHDGLPRPGRHRDDAAPTGVAPTLDCLFLLRPELGQTESRPREPERTGQRVFETLPQPVSQLSSPQNGGAPQSTAQLKLSSSLSQVPSPQQ